MDISGLEKTAVLAVLYNAAAPRRLGFMKYDDRPMDLALAQRVIDERGSDIFIDQPVMRMVFPGPPYLGLDYVFGRPIKVSLWDDTVEVESYELANNHPGLAAKALAAFRATGDVNAQDIFALHVENLERAAREAYDELDEATREEIVAGVLRRRAWLTGDADRVRAVLERILLAKPN